MPLPFSGFRSLSGMQIAGWAMTLVAPVLLVVAGIGLHRERQFVAVASTAQATVVALEPKYSGDDHPTYAPIYVFKDAAGAERRVASGTSSYPAAYKVGDKVGVLYDPRAPGDAQIASFFDMWGWMTIVAAIGAVNGLIGPALLLAGRTRTAREGTTGPA